MHATGSHRMGRCAAIVPGRTPRVNRRQHRSWPANKRPSPRLDLVMFESTAGRKSGGDSSAGAKDETGKSPVARRPVMNRLTPCIALALAFSAPAFAQDGYDPAAD